MGLLHRQEPRRVHRTESAGTAPEGARRRLPASARVNIRIPPEVTARAGSPSRGDGVMRVMMIVKATEDSEQESSPIDMEKNAEMFEAMGKFNEELVKAGVMVAGDGLKPSRFGKRVHFDGKKRSVTDSPFAETKELLAGYWAWQVRSIEEAVEWVKRCPNPMRGPSDIGRATCVATGSECAPLIGTRPAHSP